MVRSLAQMDAATLEKLNDALHEADTTGNLAPLHRLVELFESGMFLHNVRIASEQINVVAGSLKVYSREAESMRRSPALRREGGAMVTVSLPADLLAEETK